MKNICYYHTFIGRIGIAEEDHQITNLLLATEEIIGEVTFGETELLREAGRQLQEYLTGRRRVFSLPLAPAGTVFMKKVWDCVAAISYGTTQSYQAVAAALGNAKACRAVGQANNRNPIPIFIPCHRVIGANGGLTGYRGGLAVKAELLELERSYNFERSRTRCNR
jgi:methylated-DNA-[protein]-cysteine S-methyltransferase